MNNEKLDFFKFDVSAWLTGKVQILSLEERGAFIELISRIFLNSGKIKNDEFLPRILRIEKVTFSKYIDDFKSIGIIEENDGFLSVKFIDQQIQDIKDYHEERAACGAMKKGKKKVTSLIRNKKEERRDIERESSGACASECEILVHQLYDAFPRKGNLQDAQTAILNAIIDETKDQNYQATADRMLAKIEAYKSSTEKKFWQTAAVWFNARRYLEDFTPQQQGYNKPGSEGDYGRYIPTHI